MTVLIRYLGDLGDADVELASGVALGVELDVSTTEDIGSWVTWGTCGAGTVMIRHTNTRGAGAGNRVTRGTGISAGIFSGA